MKASQIPRALIDALLILTPVAIAFVRRSSTLLLAAAAFWSLLANRKALRAQWSNARLDPAVLAGLGLMLVYAALSLLWSPLPLRGAKQLVFDFAAPIAAGLILLVAPAPAPDSRMQRLFAASAIIAGLVVSAQILSGIRFESFFNPREAHAEIWRFNMVVVTLGLMLPALLLLARRLPLWSALAIISVLAASALSQSATAKTLIAAGFATYLAVSLLPRRLSLALAGLVLFSLLAIQPWQGRLVEQGFAAAGKTEILFNSAKERIVIWQASGRMALHAMPWGTGMGSSDAVSELPFAKTMKPEEWVGLRQTHAHDAFLNVLLELGLPGLVAMVLIAFGLLRSIARLPEAMLAPALALLAQVVAVDLISHGAWQAWWFTAIMLSVLALRRMSAPPSQPA